MVINETLNINLTVFVYNYFKNEIQNKLPLELNNIYNKWNTIFIDINKNISLNIHNFKYSIDELEIMSDIYNQILFHNISYDYFNSIIERRKHDFNYAINYYYNHLISKIYITYSYILNNIPINDEEYNYIVNIRAKEIQQSYKNIINKIKQTKNKFLYGEEQLNILCVNESNFYSFDNNNIIINDIPNNESLIQNVSKVNKENMEESIVSKLYLENIQNER